MADTVWTKIGRELGNVNIDRQALGELFETKTTELKVKVFSLVLVFAILETFILLSFINPTYVPPVLQRCWLGGRKGIRFVKN